MTLEEKIGQLFVVGFHGKEFSNTKIEELIVKHKIGNFIHFSRNSCAFEKHQQEKAQEITATLNKKITDCSQKALGQIPFIMVDEEGGFVSRVFSANNYYPGARPCAKGGSVEDVRKMAYHMASQMSSMGFNVNLAPVVDINSNIKNPVIGVRSYGTTPSIVSQYSEAFCDGMKEGNIYPTLKHFPGHGDTDLDSHLALPRVPHSLEKLKERELIPFVNLIKKAPLIMTSHILFPAIEPNNIPMTLSVKAINDFLIKQLGYDGLVISDCMEMKAIADNYSNYAVQSIQAGVHLVEISHTHETQIAAKNAVLKAVHSGEIKEQTIDNAVEKVLKFKNNITHFETKPTYPHELVSKISLQAIEQIRDNSFFTSNKAHDYVYVDVLPQQLSGVEDFRNFVNINLELKKQIPDIQVLPLDFEFTQQDMQNIYEKCKNKKVILGTHDAISNPLQQELCKKLHEQTEDLCVIATKNPNDIECFNFIKNYICTYEYSPCSAQALAKFISNKIAGV